MTKDYVADYRRNAAHLAATGLYDPADEHDACGVGLIAALDGEPRRQVVAAAIAALKAVWHRGAVDADGKTGDGRGSCQIPQDFFQDHIRRAGSVLGPGKLGVGMVSCRAPISAPRSARASWSSARSSPTAIPSMAGARCR